MTTLAFIDVETSGLDADRHQIWEVGALIRTKQTNPSFETEHRWFLEIDLGKADTQALAIGGYYERHPSGDSLTWKEGCVSDLTLHTTFAREFEKLTRGATLVGANPRFDALFLDKLLRSSHAARGWKFRLCDVEALVQGYMGLVEPTGLAKCVNLMNLDASKYEAHEALDDARMARDVYDSGMRGKG